MKILARYVSVSSAAVGMVCLYFYLGNLLYLEKRNPDLWLQLERFWSFEIANVAAIVLLALWLGQDKPQRATLAIVGLACGAIAWMLGFFLLIGSAAPH